MNGVEIHLAISAFALGAAFGLALGMIIWWWDKNERD